MFDFLQHLRPLLRRAVFLALAVGLLSACAAPQVQQGDLNVTIIADGVSLTVAVPSGSTADHAFEAAGVVVELNDRSEPPLYTVLSDGDQIRLVRVIEEFVIEESVIPYETQTLRNESIPEGESQLIQPGANGVLETTYRRVHEDGVEIATAAIKTVIVQPAVPEVWMVGSQAPLATLPINGRLAYVSGGNAWIMEENTGVRRPVVTTGDLDGRVFSLSPDGIWLLYTRAVDAEVGINALWVARVDDDSGLMIDLEVADVIHFADWVPGSTNGVVFSAAEPNPSPPGWQASNDLRFLNFSTSGWVSRPRSSLPGSSGGIYGWWGTDFAWAPDGEQMLYTRPDGVGFVDFEAEELRPLFDVIPLQTRSDWAWVPPAAWSPDGNYLYLVDHVPQTGLASSEESPLFDLVVVPLGAGAPLTIAAEVGMFAGPVPSPLFETAAGEQSYYVAFLQALVAIQSHDSGYRLVVMDRDASNRRVLFPPEGAVGLNPQRLAWSPELSGGAGDSLVALVYQGNLWLVDVISGEAQQLTGDDLTTAIDWK